MQYVRLGRTGLKVSRLCLGCLSYGAPIERWPWVLDEAASRPFIKKALELGINFFDTANVYSLGASEEVLGRAVKDFGRREKLVIATKVRSEMRKDDPNGRGLSRKAIMHEIDASLRRLGMDYVDLYQIHRWDYGTPIVSMQPQYNLVYREEEREMLPFCRDQGIGVIPWSPLARGFLAGNRHLQ